MKRLALAAAILIAAIAAPALAQPVRAIPADHLPDSGETDLVIAVGNTGECLAAKTSVRPGVVPYLTLTHNCRDGATLHATFLGRARVRLEVAGSGLCATVARGVIFGAPRLDMLPCSSAADQQFRIEQAEYTNVRFRSADGKCWARGGSNADDDIKIVDCSQDTFQFFRLMTPGEADGRRVPAQRVEPAKPPASQPLTILPPVILTPPPPPERTEPLATRPEPGNYRLQAWDGQCLEPQWGTDGSAMLHTRACAGATAVQIMGSGNFVTLEYPGTDKCLTLAARPVVIANCGRANAQTFVLDRLPNGSWRFRSQLQLRDCWTYRQPQPTDSPAISALEVRPCLGSQENQFWLLPRE